MPIRKGAVPLLGTVEKLVSVSLVSQRPVLVELGVAGRISGAHIYCIDHEHVVNPFTDRHCVLEKTAGAGRPIGLNA